MLLFSNVIGIYTDTRAISRLLHEFKRACFGFAARGPYAGINMRSHFLSRHKFLGGPGSPGIRLMSKAFDLLGSFPPSTCGGGIVNLCEWLT
ncbi:hypothetical protein MLD38_031475 [Melastoma candidum]|uniref:Uncharacterized protein n=1 Tax=Melastoma candidum TaxID=119954 RepID=A0ACB9MRD3_9MYRT|nr:hypothetical protein MLD38_031475 [Melastoma candidum]